MAEQGSIAITARGDNSRWYGRVSIPKSIAAEANFSSGMRISTQCVDGFIVIYSDENGRIKFPNTTGKTNPRHAFEAATTTLGLREIIMPQSPAFTFVKDGKIHIKVPEECIATTSKSRKKLKKQDVRTPAPTPRPAFSPPRDVYGATKAVVIDANRAGKKVRPMTDVEVVSLLQELGKEVVQLGPRLYKFEKVTSTIGDLLEAANKLTANSGEGTIILAMN